MKSNPRILLLSGYHAASHRYWAEQLVTELPEYEWTQVALPDRHFYWRVRSNALTFAFQQHELQADYDLILATSMVDLCNLRGLMPHLSSVPALLYFHENQFAYPQRKANSNLINAQLTSIYSALVADKLIFNSEYNKETFFDGARCVLKKMPDGTPGDLIDRLTDRAVVVPVPIRDGLLNPGSAATNRPIEILWNHRWEYDKQPQVFFSAISKLLSDGFELSLHIVGQSFREIPECFTQFQKAYRDRIQTWGFQELEDYHRVLQRADIVVSAALHDFQGLGMLEAMAAGCTPVAPDRMAYPEYVGRDYLYPIPSTTDSNDATACEAEESERLYQKLRQLISAALHPEHRKDTVDVQRYTNSALIPIYDQLITSAFK